MRKYFFLLVVAMFVTTMTNAQNESKKLFQKVKGGMITAVYANTTFSDPKNPFCLGYALKANVVVVTPKTYHNLLYGFGDNSLRFLTGYPLPKNWDAYIACSTGLSNDKRYAGFGIEKVIIGGDVKFYLYSEIGSDFKGTKILTFGMLIAVQSVIWKRN